MRLALSSGGEPAKADYFLETFEVPHVAPSNFAHEVLPGRKSDNTTSGLVGDELLLWSNVVATQIAKQINVLSTSKVPPSMYMLH